MFSTSMDGIEDVECGDCPGTTASIGVPSLLWINLMLDSGPSELCKKFSETFNVTVNKAFDASHMGVSEPPSFVCFEYDYPDCQSMRLLKDTRELYPDLPIIMFTLQHSEELAVWALRNRVWDYHFKPMGEKDFEVLSRDILRFYRNNKAVFSGRTSRRKNTSISSTYPNEVRFKRVDGDHEVIDLAVNFLASNFSSKITEKETADLCGLSRFQFSRLFKKIIGITFQNYLLNLRIDRAKQLLRNPNAKVIDVAYAVGFTDPSYFSRAFGRATGVSPSSYRING